MKVKEWRKCGAGGGNSGVYITDFLSDWMKQKARGHRHHTHVLSATSTWSCGSHWGRNTLGETAAATMRKPLHKLKLKRAPLPKSSGHHLYAYRNFRTNQVLYSLTHVLQVKQNIVTPIWYTPSSDIGFVAICAQAASRLRREPHSSHNTTRSMATALLCHTAERCQRQITMSRHISEAAGL